MRGGGMEWRHILRDGINFCSLCIPGRWRRFSSKHYKLDTKKYVFDGWNISAVYHNTIYNEEIESSSYAARVNII